MSRHPTVKLRNALLLVALAVLGGCDLLGGGETVVTGTVRLKETGEPLPGIAVSLRDGGGGFGSYPKVVGTVTDDDGRYRLHTREQGNDNRFNLFVNVEPFDPRYIDYTGDSVAEGKHTVRDVDLPRNKYCTDN